jgi:hypothetical protein
LYTAPILEISKPDSRIIIAVNCHIGQQKLQSGDDLSVVNTLMKMWVALVIVSHKSKAFAEFIFETDNFDFTNCYKLLAHSHRQLLT